MTAHKIDYKIKGKEMQYVQIEFDPQEGVIAAVGSVFRRVRRSF